MNFNSHSRLRGEHAFLSASKYHWIRYDEEQLSSSYLKYLATQKGTELHALAHKCIQLGVRLPKGRKTFNQYVNDALGFRMRSEQVLYYSDNAFGTADTISFRDNMLRIHDLKTGVSPVSMNQLEVYAAFFCLEYNVNPEDISIELRIYQMDDVTIHAPSPEHIREIMEKIIIFDKRIEILKEGDEFIWLH